MKWFSCQISVVQTSKPNNGPSEFADMWKELKVKDSSPSGHSTSTYSNINTAPVHEKDYREKEITENDLMIKVKIAEYSQIMCTFI